MGARIREADWASTPLGPPETWPPALRTATGIVLTARFPMLIAWGPELIQLYNDAMIPVLGEQHPQTARPLTDTLAPLLEQVRPFVDAVLAGDEAMWQPEQRVWLDRLGTPEDLYFMSSYSPILDDEGAVGGLLVTAFETTPRVLDARRLRAVSDLVAATVEAATAEGALAAGLEALGHHPEDLPFALVYRREPGGGAALEGTIGLPDGSALAPARLDPDAAAPWPWPAEPVTVDGLDGRAEPQVHAFSGYPVTCARVLPLGSCRMLVAGVSPSRRLDDAYLRYFGLIAGGLARAIDHAAAHERELQAAATLAVAAREQAENERVRISEERLRTAIAAAGTGILLAAEGRITDVNPAFCQLLLKSEEELLGTVVVDLIHPDDLADALTARERVFAGDADSVSHECRLCRSDGEAVWVMLDVAVVRDEQGAPRHFVINVQDLSERRRSERHLRYLADHDVLTGLVNRRRFGEELDRIIAEAERYQTPGSVVMLDLDGLKGVNDAYGHACGDDLLAGVAELLRGRLRGTDVAARLGGDEFALVLPHTAGPAAEVLARDILDRISQAAPLLLGGAPMRVSASAGIAEIGGRRHWTDAEEVLHHADTALYAAKRAGRDCVRMANPRFIPRGRRGLSHGSDRPLEQRGLELYAQPILALSGDPRDRRELLLRLRSDDGGIMAPAGFLAGAERSDLILEVDRWVIRESTRVLASARQQGLDTIFHVNLSARSLTDAPMAGLIATELDRAGVDPAGLVFEITESAAITSIDRAQRFAEQVAQLGCGLALDDFGAGFASFHYLKYLEFDFVKIDGGLVRDVVHSHGDQRILRCIVDLAQGLGKRTIAEWVTDEATLEVMRAFGVDYAQGFHVSLPAALPGLAATS